MEMSLCKQNGGGGGGVGGRGAIAVLYGNNEMYFLENTCDNEFIVVPMQWPHDNVVITGATSCYGYQLLRMLRDGKINVTLVEDIDSLGASTVWI